MAYIIAEPCVDVKDASCVDVCPVDCIYEGDRMFYIEPDECIDCAACEPVCPVAAIFAEDGASCRPGPLHRDQQGPQRTLTPGLLSGEQA